MKFLSVCSGIEAASVAWTSLGFEPVAFSEIESFPCAVLKHHYPSVPNLGDITKFKDWPDYAIDILVGGTPCQSFSVAGLRKGMADPRGNLALTFLAIADRYAPTWICWENVPGVLSSDEGRDFGAFLGGLAAIGYGFAYRVLDAQFFGLAQRRKRVFVVGCAGGQWQRAAAVLFERESLCGHPAPSRETEKGITYSTSPSLTGSGRGTARSGESRGQDCVIPIQEIGKRQSGTPMNGVGHGEPGDPMFTLQQSAVHGVCATLTKNYATHHGRTAGNNGGVAENQLIAFSSKDSGGDAATEIAPTLRAGTHDKSHANSGSHIAIAHTLKADGFDASEDGIGRGIPLVADCLQERDSKGSDSSTKNGHLLPESSGMAVRRLTPKECCRLQGFPDDYLDITYRGRPSADGPKYKALGNSMAVPVIKWIGRRIQILNEL